jgi:hypothetical protein
MGNIGILERDVRWPQTKVHKIFKAPGNNVKENVKINNIPHGSSLNYLQNLRSQVYKPFNMQPILYQNSEAITLNKLTHSYNAKKVYKSMGGVSQFIFVQLCRSSVCNQVPHITEYQTEQRRTPHEAGKNSYNSSAQERKHQRVWKLQKNKFIEFRLQNLC